MKVNLQLNDNNIIIGFSIIPFDENLPTLDVDEPYKDIQVGIDSFIDGKLVKGTAKEDTFGRILELKKKLTNTDYKLMKFMEGELSEEEYEPIKQQRQQWRNEINDLESKGE